MAQSSATQSYTCSLSGLSPLPPGDAVVTPSGYICSRKLLLTKLSENGGVDPFDDKGVRALDESSLIELSGGRQPAAVVPPRPPTGTSLPSLLSSLQNEFDAVLLELYDTRRALEETRRELSGALYQNDAAVRVVARVCRERDEVRLRLEGVLKEGVAARDSSSSSGEVAKRVRDEQDVSTDRSHGGADSSDANPAKKAKVDSSSIPPADLEAMSATWATLSKNRRTIAKLKRTPEEIAAIEGTDGIYAKLMTANNGEDKKVNLHKSNAKAGVLALAHVTGDDGVEYVISGGHDKQAIVYNASTGVIAASLTGASDDVVAVDGMMVDNGLVVVVGSNDGSVRLYSVGEEGELIGAVNVDDSPIVHVAVHPSSTKDEVRILAATKGGSVAVLKYNSEGGIMKVITQLRSEEGAVLSGAAMHPDGLIYAVGSEDGKMVVWDLKTQTCAATLEVCFAV